MYADDLKWLRMLDGGNQVGMEAFQQSAHRVGAIERESGTLRVTDKGRDVLNSAKALPQGHAR
jgi:hypothetical protein